MIGGEAPPIMMICSPPTQLALMPLLADAAKPTWLSTSRGFRYFLQDSNAPFGDPQGNLSLARGLESPAVTGHGSVRNECWRREQRQVTGGA